MKVRTKATLLSALVFPGMGQILLKRYYRAALFCLVALGSLAILVNIAIEQALVISDQIISGQVATDIHSISVLVTQSASKDAAQSRTVTDILLVVWVLSILDTRLFGIPGKNITPVNEKISS